MVVQSGIVVDEWGETTQKYNVHSIRKSLLSALIGIYENQGTLKLESTLEELRIDDRLGLTIDLLGSRSGIYHPANLVGEEASENWPKRGSHAPGTHWFYSNWDRSHLREEDRPSRRRLRRPRVLLVDFDRRTPLSEREPR